MKRHNALQPLSRDHHDGLILAQLLKKDVKDYQGMPSEPEEKARYAVDLFKKSIQPHFKKEEEILMPATSGRDSVLDQYHEQLKVEHQQIQEGFEAIEAGTYNEDSFDNLGRLLERHIRTEEREYFPKVQEIMSEEELADLSIPENQAS